VGLRGASHHQPENAPGFGDRDERAAEMKRATRGVEFLMSYYSILDRAPKGRDEGDAWQVWIRRHDEYDSQ
jgi:predicted dithiol-disulfide oxidoreductase (DUF899 family)